MSTTSTASGRPTLASRPPGVDGETWQHYGEDLEGNLQELSLRQIRSRTQRRAGSEYGQP